MNLSKAHFKCCFAVSTFNVIITNNNNSTYAYWIFAMYQVLFITFLLMLTTTFAVVAILPLSVVKGNAQGHITGEKLSDIYLPLFWNIWRESVKVLLLHRLGTIRQERFYVLAITQDTFRQRRRNRQLLKPLCFRRDIYESGCESRMPQPVTECKHYNQCYGTQQKWLKQKKETSNLGSPFPSKAGNNSATHWRPTTALKPKMTEPTLPGKPNLGPD